MLKNYVLGAEVAEKGDFHIANISMLLNDGTLVEGVDYLKYGGITLLSKQSLVLPVYIRNIMWRKDISDLKDLVPFTYFKDLVDNNIKTIADLYENVTICDKKFVRPLGDLKDIILNEKLVKSVVSNKEVPGLYKDELISGDLKVSKSKNLVWY